MNPLSPLFQLGKLASSQYDRMFRPFQNSFDPFQNGQSVNPANPIQQYPSVQENPVDINAAFASGGLKGPTGLVGYNGQPMPVPQTQPYQQKDIALPQQNIGATGGAFEQNRQWLVQPTPPGFLGGSAPQAPIQQQAQPEQQVPAIGGGDLFNAFALSQPQLGQSFFTGGLTGGGQFGNSQVLAALLQALQGGMGTSTEGGADIDPVTGKKKKKNPAQRHNNPTNLIFAGQPGATPGDEKAPGMNWANFPSPEAGFEAARSDIQAKLNRTPDMTLEQLINIRSPRGENDTGKLVSDISRSLQADPTMRVADIDMDRLLNVLARFEGFYAQ